VEFVDFADAVDAQAVLADAGAIAEAGGAGVAGAGDDFAETVAHGWFPRENEGLDGGRL
jgi:hypothetical protein